jgi:hypothetical protein
MMSSIIRKSAITLVAAMAMAGVQAQSSAPAMPEAVINLNKFNGSWQASVSSQMGDKTYKFDYTVKCTPVAGGNGSYWEESGSEPSIGDMSASDLIGYNRTDGKLHCYSVDNMGTTRDNICEWKSPDHLVMQYQGRENGKQIVSKMDLVLTGDDVMEFTMNTTQDGKPQMSGSGTFHKIEGK